jgi:acyl-ACP thioesterase
MVMMRMIPALEMPMKPTTYECGPDGKMRHFHLMKHFQEIASMHAERMGLGMGWMMKNGLIWVLVDMRLGIVRMPRWKESCTIYTIPSGYDSLRAFREFIVTDGEENQIVKGSSVWMVLDMKKKRPMPTEDLDFNFPKDGKRNFSGILRSGMPDSMDLIGDLVVEESSIDLNGHVNNTEYVRWAVDSIRRTETTPPPLNNLLMSYKAEVFKGDTIRILSDFIQNKLIIVIERSGVGKPVFTMEIL